MTILKGVRHYRHAFGLPDSTSRSSCAIGIALTDLIRRSLLGHILIKGIEEISNFVGAALIFVFAIAFRPYVGPK